MKDILLPEVFNNGSYQEGREAFNVWLKDLYSKGSTLWLQVGDTYIDRIGQIKLSKRPYQLVVGDNTHLLYEAQPQKAEVEGYSQQWIPTRIVSHDAFSWLLKKSKSGCDIFYRPAVMGNGIGSGYHIDTNEIVVEADKSTIAEQLQVYAHLASQGLKPTSLVFTGGKSLHAHYNIFGGMNAATSRDYTARLTSIVEGDPTMVVESQAVRVPGMIRVKDNAEKQVSILYHSDARYTADEFEALLNKVWSYEHPFDQRRWTAYKNLNAKNKSAIQGLERLGDVFNIPEELLTAFVPEDSRDQAYIDGIVSGSISKKYNPVVEVATHVQNDILKCRTFNEIYGLTGGDRVNNDRTNYSNPLSQTNSTGSSFSTYRKSGMFYDWCNRVSGFPFQFHCYKLHGRTTGIRGKQYIETVKSFCKEYGYDYDELYSQYNKKDYELQALEILESSENIELQEEIKAQSLEVVYPTEDFTQSAKVADRSKLLVIRCNPSEAQSYADLYDMPVLAAKFYSEALEASLTAYAATIGKKFKLVVLPLPGEVTTPLGMAFFSALNTLSVGLSWVLRFVWYGQNKSEARNASVEDIKCQANRKKFEEIERVYYSIKRKEANRLLMEPLRRLNRVPDFTFNSRYVSQGMCKLIPGKIMVLSSSIGTGKTEWMAEEICEFWKNNPDKKPNLPGYRNGLLDGLAKRINDKAESYGLSQRMKRITDDKDNISLENAAGLEYCINSILKIELQQALGAPIYLDEFESILNCLFSSKLLEGNRGLIFEKFVQLIQQGFRTGQVVCMEANITQLTFDFLINVCGFSESDIYYCKNEYKALTMDCNLYSSASYVDADGIAKVKAGKKMLFARDSADAARALYENISVQCPDKKGLLICNDTLTSKNNDDVRDFLKTSKESILDNDWDYLIYSPTMESGSDISYPHFDEVNFIFNNLDTRSQIQMLGRERNNIPRNGFVTESAMNDCTNRSFEVAAMREDKLLNSKNREKFIEMLTDSEEDAARLSAKIYNSHNVPESIEYKVMDLSCLFDIRWNIYRGEMRHYFIQELTEQGHTVTQIQVENDDEAKASMGDAKERVIDRDAEEWATADTSGMTVDAANKTLGCATKTKEDGIKAQKRLLQEEAPTFDFNRTNCKELFVKDHAKGKKEAQERFNVVYLEQTKEKEAKSHIYKASQPFIFVADDNIKGQRAELFDRLGIIALATTQHEFYAEDEAVKALYQQCLYAAKDIKRLIKITVTPKSKPMALLNKLFSKLGWTLRKKSYKMIDGKQTHVYEIDYESDKAIAIESFYEACIRKQELGKSKEVKLVQRVLELGLEEAKSEEVVTTEIKPSGKVDRFLSLDLTEQLRLAEIGNRMIDAIEVKSFTAFVFFNKLTSQLEKEVIFHEYLSELQQKSLVGLLRQSEAKVEGKC